MIPSKYSNKIFVHEAEMGWKEKKEFLIWNFSKEYLAMAAAFLASGKEVERARYFQPSLGQAWAKPGPRLNFGSQVCRIHSRANLQPIIINK